MRLAFLQRGVGWLKSVKSTYLMIYRILRLSLLDGRCYKCLANKNALPCGRAWHWFASYL